MQNNEDIMLPNPSEEQVALWNRIDAGLEVKDIEVKSSFAGLSDRLQAYLASTETAKQIEAIAGKYKIPKETAQLLTRITGLTAMGKIHINDFVRNIYEQCRFSETTAKQIGNAINQKIFFSIRDELKTIHKVAGWPGERVSETKESPPPPAPQPSNSNVVDLKNKN